MEGEDVMETAMETEVVRRRGQKRGRQLEGKEVMEMPVEEL